MNKNKEHIEESLKIIDKIKEMNIKSVDDAKRWTKRIVDVEYRNNIECAYLQLPHLRSLYKMIKINNFMARIIKEDIYNANEEFFSEEFKLVRRIHSSLSFISSEIQMLLEQRHSFSALAKMRQVIELGVTYKLIKHDSNIYRNAMEQGSYTLIGVESFFYSKPTKESVMFKEYFEKKITPQKRRDPYNWIKKSDSKQFKKFSMSEYVKKYYGNDPILLHTWNSSHNFNHMGSLTFALDEKPHIYENMEEYFVILIIFSLFKIYKEVISDSIKYAKENKRILEKNGIYEILKIYYEIMDALDETLGEEKELMEYIEVCKKEYENELTKIKNMKIQTFKF